MVDYAILQWEVQWLQWIKDAWYAKNIVEKQENSKDGRKKPKRDDDDWKQVQQTTSHLQSFLDSRGGGLQYFILYPKDVIIDGDELCFDYY